MQSITQRQYEFQNENSNQRAHLALDCRQSYIKIFIFVIGENDRSLMGNIERQIANNRGRELPNFIMYPVFETLVWKVIREMRDPGVYCLKDVDRSIDKVLDKLCTKWFCRFPQIMGDVKVWVRYLIG